MQNPGTAWSQAPCGMLCVCDAVLLWQREKPRMVSTVKLSGKLVWHEPTVTPFLLLCRKMLLLLLIAFI